MWIAWLLILVLFIVFLFWAFPKAQPKSLSDAQIVQEAAKAYNVNLIELNPKILNAQMIISTLGNSALVPKENIPDTPNYDENLPYFQIAITPLPSSYQVGSIYVLNYMTPIGTTINFPIIIDESFEVFLTAVNMIYNRNIKATLLFNLTAFGSQNFIAYSTLEINSLSSVEIYPWTPLEYFSIIQQIGPAKKYGFFNPLNY